MTETAGRVLVIEDDEAKRYVLVRALRAASFEVTETNNGERGLVLVRALPDLVVLDIRLPGIGGLEVCQRIKADPLTAGVLVLELSARHISASDRVIGLDGGADAYLMHPVESTVLVATVASLLRTRRLERDRAALERRFEASERRYQTVADNATVGLFQTDAAGVCTFVNRAGARLLQGASPLGRPLGEFFSRRAGLPVPDFAVAHLPLPAERMELQTSRAPLPVTVTASALALDEHESGAVVEVKDDTEVVEAEKLRILFLAALGHDLRGPLQSLLMANELLQQSATGESALLLTRMRRTTTRMHRLIEHLLVFAQGLHQGMPLSLGPVVLRELCESAVREALLRSAGARVELRGGEGVEGRWDADRLSQVLDNLLGNALTHGRGPVTVTLSQHGERVTLRVHNEGEPIDPQLLPVLFDPFRRGGGGRSGGVGLGLFIVAMIVRAHGGELDVRSDAESGTTFTVSLPLESAEP